MMKQGKCIPCKIRWEWEKELRSDKCFCPFCENRLEQTSCYLSWPTEQAEVKDGKLVQKFIYEPEPAVIDDSVWVRVQKEWGCADCVFVNKERLGTQGACTYPGDPFSEDGKTCVVRRTKHDAPKSEQIGICVTGDWDGDSPHSADDRATMQRDFERKVYAECDAEDAEKLDATLKPANNKEPVEYESEPCYSCKNPSRGIYVSRAVDGKMQDVAICDACWEKEQPGRVPVRLKSFGEGVKGND